MLTSTLIEAAIMGIASFTLISVISLKVQVAKIFTKLENAEEYTYTFRSKTQEDIKELRLEVKELWEASHELKLGERHG